jgi:TM2 domain-containing membrane protein YozV
MIEMIKSPGIAVLISFIIPGGGSIYSERIGKGIAYLIFNFMSLLCFAIFEMYLPLALAFAVLALFAYIFSVVAAYYDAKRFNLKKGDVEK